MPGRFYYRQIQPELMKIQGVMRMNNMGERRNLRVVGAINVTLVALPQIDVTAGMIAVVMGNQDGS